MTRMRIVFEKLRYSFLTLILLLVSLDAAFSQQVEWLNDLDRAQQIARETGKPILYDFTAAWCGPCRRMDKEFWPKAEVVELSKQFVCVKVNFDTEKTFAAKYSIKAIPNVVFTDPWGRGLVGQKGFGAGTTTEILDKIKYLPKDFSSLRDAGNTLEADDKNLDALYQFAKFYQERKFYWLGNGFYERLLYLEVDLLKRESILLNLAFNHIRMEEPAEAIARFESLQKEYPKSAQNDLYLHGLVVASVKKKDQPGANKYLAELRLKFPASEYVAHAETSIAELGPVKAK